jgi:CheY-like chemotaxis protein
VQEEKMNPELKRITYVEDEPDIRTIGELALTKIGNFTVDVCCSGAEAIDKTPLFKPDLILLDVMMPGIDGIETFHSLQAIPETAGIPLIFMTAKAQKHEIQGYKDLGAIDVIPKPFDPMTLAQDITAIWKRVSGE